MTFLLIATIFALGACVQTIAGFGSALIIMPILTQFIGVQTAASVMALVGATVTLSVLYQNRGGLRWREAGRLLAGSVVGVPLGALALKFLPPAPVMALLGVVLLIYGIYTLAAARSTSTPGGVALPCDREPAPSRRATTALVGFCSGLLGGAYATDGPPLVIYGSIKKWPKESFRSILQACFLVNGILIVACHGAGGLVTRDVIAYCIYGIPGMLAGLLIGTLLDRRINHALFHRLLVWLILLLAAALLARAAMEAAAVP
jgi:uncharacterized membrane protein YfcA